MTAWKILLATEDPSSSSLRFGPARAVVARSAAFAAAAVDPEDVVDGGQYINIHRFRSRLDRSVDLLFALSPAPRRYEE
jgi:hypothetical protein